MKHYLSPTGVLYAYEEDGSQDHLIPADFVISTEEETYAIQNKPLPVAPLSIQQQIDELERTQMLPRITREFMLAQFVNVAMAQGIDPMTNQAYTKLKAFNDQITALRAQL